MVALFAIWFTIFITNMVMTWLAVEECKDTFHRKYPELKLVKKHWSVEANAYARLVIYALIPIFHIGMLWSLIVHHDKLIENSVHKTYLECMEEQENAQKTSDISGSSET